MTEVVNLREDQPTLARTEPVAEIVEKLEEALAAAKSGEIRSLAIVFQRHHIAHPDCSYETAYDFDDDSNIFSLLGALDRLKHRMNLELDEDE